MVDTKKSTKQTATAAPATGTIAGVPVSDAATVAAANAAAEAKRVEDARKLEEKAKKDADALAKKEAAELKKKADAQKRADEKAQKDKERADAKVAAEAAKQLKADQRAAEKAKKEQEKADAKAARDREKLANTMPEQNGVRRPKPDTLCGKAWAVCDAISAQLGAPAPIAYVLEGSKSIGLNEGNVKAEYARWKKFNGVTGRVAVPLPADISAAVAGVNVPAPVAPVAADPSVIPPAESVDPQA